jgi:hypothetical protein
MVAALKWQKKKVKAAVAPELASRLAPRGRV